MPDQMSRKCVGGKRELAIAKPQAKQLHTLSKRNKFAVYHGLRDSASLLLTAIGDFRPKQNRHP